MSTQGPDHPESFRDRLARIPKIEDDRSMEERWETAAPPVVKRPAPVARPAAAPIDSPGSTPDYDLLSEPRAPEEDGRSPGEGLPGDFQGYVDGYASRRRRRWPKVLLGVCCLLGLLLLVSFLRARQVFNSIERVAVAEVLTPPAESGTNLLLIGTDSRSGITQETENAGVIMGADPVAGERTDTIMVLRVLDDGSAKLLSLPRDLWLPINGGAPQRINTAIVDGPEALIQTVQNELDVPISHYAQVDLAGFIDLVDAVGGVEITIPYPAFDDRSGLRLPTAGVVELDSTQALAYVRSRYYTELVDGVERTDLTSDLGRVQRQQTFIRALLDKLSSQRNPRVIDSMATELADSIVLDDATTLTDVISIANTLRATTPESVVLPTDSAAIGGRSVLVLSSNASDTLSQFTG